jgi:hypothetical protein
LAGILEMIKEKKAHYEASFFFFRIDFFFAVLSPSGRFVD